MRRVFNKYQFFKRCLSTKFHLNENFLEKYQTIEPDFGFDGLGKVVYYRSYSRIKENGENEDWYETVQRVVEGTYNLQKIHSIEWDDEKAQVSAQRMYEKIFDFKFLPSGRGLYAMGTELTEKKKLYASLNSCAFVSTEDIDQDPIKPFLFLFDLSMCGVGVGFDCKGSGKVHVRKPDLKNEKIFKIEDSREGWIESLRILLESYFYENSPYPNFDLTNIRKKGLPLKHFGGYSPGPKPLKELHDDVKTLLDNKIGEVLNVENIVDLMNIIGKCVISGGIRRTAEIALCEFEDDEFEDFVDLKNYEKNAHRIPWGWASNNSVIAKPGTNYDALIERIVDNGEPGVCWLENMQNFSRMDSIKGDMKDLKVKGGNPCLEQSLESYELCVLVETFPYHHETIDEFLETLDYAFLYGKSVTLGEIHWDETNQVLDRNRRIGTSMSGIVQFVAERGIGELQEWCVQGYDHLEQVDEKLSNWLDIPLSIKKTSVKPSGTLSLLAGATPGVHFPESRFYIRRLRMTKDSRMIEELINCGYIVEEDESNPTNCVVEFPIAMKEDIRTNKEVSMWEKLSLAAFLQKFWSDNQVSCTVTFDAEKESKDVKHALDYFQYQLKGISFLPMKDEVVFNQMPYEQISEEEYLEKIENLRVLNFSNIGKDAESEKFCSNDTCTL